MTLQRMFTASRAAQLSLLALPARATTACTVCMSLRDYFAARAIDRMISLCTDRNDGWDAVAVAVGCYTLADAMLAERKAK